MAREGKIVARLKSGDPLLFGRAGEEMEALRQAGIEFEVIPGVTAALGAAASARISLTDRRHASRVVFVTAHREGGTGLTNERHVAADTTYVIYMPGNRYAELACGIAGRGNRRGDSLRRNFARDHEGRNDFPHDGRQIGAVPRRLRRRRCSSSASSWAGGERRSPGTARLSSELERRSFESCSAASIS